MNLVKLSLLFLMVLFAVFTGCPFHSDDPEKCKSNQCSPNGHCEDDQGYAACVCDDGYREDLNEERELDCVPAVLVGHHCSSQQECEQRAYCSIGPPGAFEAYCTIPCSSAADCPEDEVGVAMCCEVDQAAAEEVCTRVEQGTVCD